MTLLAKPWAQQTAAEKQSLYKAIGTAALPYPATHFVSDATGALKLEVGIIADDANPLAYYSTQPDDYSIGLLYRDMPVPSLLHVQKEALLRRNPNSKNRIMIILGHPGAGKSYLSKNVAKIRDQRGAETIDCGGRYMGDLLFEQVIDYGEDFKTALTERLRAGGLSERSTEILEENFSDAITKNNVGKIIDITWDKAATPKPVNASDENSTAEKTEHAVERTLDLIKKIAEWEGIPTQAVNSVGVKKVPGVIKRWFDEGREGILDEYTKSIEGTDDSLQTVLQFANGEIDEVTVTNSMKVSGREETYSYTLRREDMKPGFFITLTGNKENDGFSTHSLSRSAYSRIPVFTIDDPLAIDWRHRISQVLTGVPLSTLYSVFSNTASDDSEEFGDMMIELRQMGLSDEEKLGIPPHQMVMLKNWQQTNAAVEKLSNFYTYWSKIVDPQSDLYDPDKQQNKQNIEDILPEISATYRDESAIDFRKVIQHAGDALEQMPEVKEITSGSNLRLNFSAIGRQMVMPRSVPEIVSSEYGARLEKILLERVATMTTGRPKLQAALMKEGRDRGIFPMPAPQTGAAQPVDTIRTLLNQDLFEKIGGIKAVIALRDTLAAHKRNADPMLQAKTDNDLVPMAQAVAASKELMQLAGSVSTNPRVGRLVGFSDNAENMFIESAAVDGIAGSQNDSAFLPAQLVKTSNFLETLAAPSLARVNMMNIWRNTISAEKLIPASNQATPLIQLAEGTHPQKLGITTLMMQGVKGDSVPTHVMIDGERRKSLIVTDAIDPTLKAMISNQYTVVTYDEVNAKQQVQNFIEESLKYSTRRPTARALEEQLTSAFLMRAGDESKPQALATMMTTPDLPAEAPVYIINQPV